MQIIELFLSHTLVFICELTLYMKHLLLLFSSHVYVFYVDCTLQLSQSIIAVCYINLQLQTTKLNEMIMLFTLHAIH